MRRDPSRHIHEWSAWKPERRQEVWEGNTGNLTSEVIINVRYCVLPKCGLTQEKKAATI